MHPITTEPGSAVAAALTDEPSASSDGVPVNTYHHQAVGRDDIAPGLVATAWASGPDGDVVEALELPGDRFVVGVQCHPERTEFSPGGFERLWAAFVEACRVAVKP
jgi:putative glutamine amidotransferase